MIATQIPMNTRTGDDRAERGSLASAPEDPQPIPAEEYQQGDPQWSAPIEVVSLDGEVYGGQHNHGADLADQFSAPIVDRSAKDR